MTVIELIEHLNSFDPFAEIYFRDLNGQYDTEVLDVENDRTSVYIKAEI